MSQQEDFETEYGHKDGNDCEKSGLLQFIDIQIPEIDCISKLLREYCLKSHMLIQANEKGLNLIQNQFEKSIKELENRCAKFEGLKQQFDNIRQILEDDDVEDTW
ncbi:hypothetical protein Ciccas_006819 [Cichlidogyrus casuarinus]|uniref:Uncharacterized protein n=1 Tax=Cichlidogyrus casuarinus TaxID=1844966 RepID=A0ABD2Q5Q1_9PLAT